MIVSTRMGGAKTPKTAAGKAPAAGRRWGETTSKSKPQARGAATAPPAARPSTGTKKKKAQVLRRALECAAPQTRSLMRRTSTILVLACTSPTYPPAG